MRMIIKIAWRNIWRNRLRSLVVMSSIAIGIWAGMFIISFSWGMYNHRIDDAIKNEISNIQIHDSLFGDEFNIHYTIPDANQIRTKTAALKGIRGVSNRAVGMAMIGSAHGNNGIKITGIDTIEEDHVSGLKSKITSGRYLEGSKRNPILIGKKLGDKLQVKLKSTLVVTLQDSSGEIVSEAFKVVGFFETANSKFEEMNAYVRRDDLRKMIGINNAVHEIAISLNKNEDTDSLASQLKSKYPELLVQSWGDIMPEMAYAIEMFDQIMNLIIFIIMLALAFGIINTMLMAILERVKELGMLMAVGMNKIKVFGMIMMETIFLTLVGVPIGLLLSYITISYFGKYGIDLSLYSDALSSYGFDSMVFLKAEPHYYLQIIIQVVIVAIISSIIPARRALKLNPVEAIRSL